MFLTKHFICSKECIWSLLTGLLTQTNSSKIIQYITEIEVWILRLLSIPVPVPGKTKLEVRKMLQKNFVNSYNLYL